MYKNLISVIVPIYNTEPYLDKCITSIVQQSYPNLEIILVDDGSLDKCPQMCDRWAKQDERICAIHKENGGVSSARNAGLRIAKGEFISFVDPDDYIAPKMLEMMIGEMRDERVGIVECGLQEVFPDHVRNCISHDSRLQADNAIEQLLRWTGNVGSAVWNKLFRRTVLKGVEFCEKIHYGEDTPFMYDALKKTDVYAQIPFIGYYHLMRKDSLVGDGFKTYKLHSLWAAELVAKSVEKDFPQFVDQAHCHVMLNAFAQMNSLLSTKDAKKVFGDEYVSIRQKLRNSKSFVLVKYISRKRYILFQLCYKAPLIYQFIYCPWQKRKRK